MLEYLPLVQDYSYTKDVAAQKKIHELLTDGYESLSFPVMHVPVLSPETRVDLILKNL